jgi:hypothetical protein
VLPLLTPFTRKATLAAAATVALVLGVGLFFVLRKPAEGDGPDLGRAQAGFRECAAESGITFRMNSLPNEQGVKFKVNLYDHGCGVAVGDFDGDGHDDVYFVNQLGPNKLFRNKGDGTFEDVTDRAGVGLGDRGVCVGATWADYDNDGHLDLFVTTTRGGNVLFHNNGDGTFTDVTREAGLELPSPRHAQTAVFFDFDNDGLLDLLVTNTARWTHDDYDKEAHYFPGKGKLFDLVDSEKEQNILYRNLGGGKFKDVTKESGLEGKGWGGDVAVFDFNEDGRLDVLITNMFGASQLYRNDGGGKFTDVTREVLGRPSWGAVGCKAFASTNDGHLDLLLVDMHSDMWMPISMPPRKSKFDLKKKYGRILGPFADVEGNAENEQRLAATINNRYDDVQFGNTLFRWQPSGKFQEVSDQAGLETWWPWGIATGDFDNDGHEDVFIPSGMGFPYEYWPNFLMMNNGDGTFTDRARDHGIEPRPGGETGPELPNGTRPARSSRCAAAADFDGDGRLDLVVNNFNDHAFYFRNHFPKRNYVAFRLTGNGTTGNRDAVGARVKLYIGKEVLVRQVQTAGGYLSQASKTLHFGLGDRPSIDRAEVLWPGSTEPQPLKEEEYGLNKVNKLTQPK